MKKAKNAKKHLLTKNSRLARNRSLASAVAVGSAITWMGASAKPANAQAILNITGVSGDLTGTHATQPYVIGDTFTVGSGNITLTELGAQDTPTSGTVGYSNTGTLTTGMGGSTFAVGIWNGNGTLIALTDVTQTDLLGAGNFRSLNCAGEGVMSGNASVISSITLTAGGNYTIGALVPTGDFVDTQPSAAFAGNGITFLNAVFASSSTLTIPNTASSALRTLGRGSWGWQLTALTTGTLSSTADYSTTPLTPPIRAAL